MSEFVHDKAEHPGEPSDSELLAMARAEIADLAVLLPGTYYMDPPDGGNVTILEQLQRMARDAACYRGLRVPAFPFAVFDEFGKGADDRVQDYAAAAVAAERVRCADELAAEITLDGFGCACEPRKQCGTCNARGVLEKALSPMVRRLRA